MEDATTVLFDGELHVQYGFVHLGLEDRPADDIDVVGQANGLCAAGTPGVITVLTGTHTGLVPLTVVLLDAEPPVDPGWEEVVEVSWESDGTATTLATFDDGTHVRPVPAGTYRIRLSATGLDEAHDLARGSTDPEVDRYRLELWTAPWSRDAVLRTTSTTATWRHRSASSGPARDRVTLVEAQLAERRAEELRATAAQEEGEAAEHALDQHLVLVAWGGLAPTPALLAIGGRASQVARVDRGLVEAIAAADPEIQRRLAVRVARDACRLAGIDDQAPVAAALAALAASRALPPPFDDRDAAYGSVFGGSRAEIEMVVTSAPIVLPVLDPAAAAIGAVLGAGEDPPVLAAVEALADASAAHADRHAFLADVHAWLSTQPDD